MGTSDDLERHDGLLLTVFSFLWASASLFSLHAAWGWGWQMIYDFPSARGVGDGFVALSAVMVLLRPQSVGRLGMHCLAVVVQTLGWLPQVPNHRMLMFFVSLAVLLALASAWFSGVRGASLGPAVLRRFAPTARAATILLYFFAVLAKLNFDYVNPEHSCSIQFYANIHSWLWFLPDNDALDLAIIYGTLGVEALLPALLIWKRFRIAGVILGLAFHFVLALDLVKLFLNFSAVMSALLVLFLPRNFFIVLRDRWDEKFGHRGERHGAARTGLLLRRCAFVCMLLLIGDVFLPTHAGTHVRAYLLVVGGLWALYSLVLMGSVIWYLSCRKGGPGEAPAMPSCERMRLGVSQAGVVGLVVLNGLCPYLGLKTRTSFNMYSNLRVEPGYSNHFFLPGSLDLLGNLSDTVTVIESNDPQLQWEFAEAGLRMTHFEFTSYARGRADLQVTYERGGERCQFIGGRTDPGELAPPPWILRKVLVYRPIGEGVEKRCIW